MRTKYLRNSVFLLIISILLSLAVSEIIMRKILPRPYIYEISHNVDAVKNLALKYKPDIVILAFCLWNDIANNLSAFHLVD